MDSPKITDVWTAEVSVPLRAVLENASVRFRERRTLLVVIESADGLFGVGESGAGNVGLARVGNAGIRGLVEEGFAPSLVGQRIINVPRLLRGLQDQMRLDHRGLISAALSGIDIAMWDLKAKAEGLPLHSLLGKRRQSVRAYATGGFYSKGGATESAIASLRGRVAEGFEAVKLKAYPQDAGRDEQIIASLRATYGASLSIAIDYSYALTELDAVRIEQELAKYNLWFLETPVGLTDYFGMSRIRERSSTPIAGNERLSTAAEFAHLVQCGCVDIVQPSVTMCGGVSSVLEIADVAEAYRLPISLQCSGSAVALAATLQVAGALPNVHSVEVHDAQQMLGEYLPIEVANGLVTIPQGLGLGIDSMGIAELQRLRMGGTST